MSSDRDPRLAAPPELDNASEDAVPVQSSNGFLVDEGSVDGAASHPNGTPPARSVAPSSAEAPATDLLDILRIAGWGLIGLSWLIYLGTRSIPFPLLMLVVGVLLVFYISSPERLRREQVIDRWDTLISGGHGHADPIVTSTVWRIDQQQLPRVHYEQCDVSPGILSSLAGKTRPFLVISQSANRRLQPYRMYVNVRDYGDNLQASWYLAYHRSFFERFKPNPLVQLDLFDEQDLRAYVSAVHHCFTDAVVELVTSLGQDTSRVDRSSKGFLGIS